MELKNILVTGGAGFIGSNFVRYMLNNTNYNIINYDLLTYSGNLNNLKDIKENSNYHFVHGDICDKDAVRKVFKEYSIDTVVNFAAESHVDRSIETPEIFVKTNVLGTSVLIDVAKENWKVKPNDKYDKEFIKGVKFLQVSTDEVYGSLGKEGMFTETTPLSPNSPYSASKASADMVVLAYHHTFNIPVNITRCSNNYGPYQFPEKLIPLMINNCQQGKELPVYGDGQQIRDWLYVEDHCSAIHTVLEKGKDGEIYNIGGNNEVANMDIVKLIINYLGKDESLIKHVKDRPGHDRRYSIDNTKITCELGWSPKYLFDDGIKYTIDWYVSNKEWMDDVISLNYLEYYKNMYK